VVKHPGQWIRWGEWRRGGRYLIRRRKRYRRLDHDRRRCRGSWRRRLGHGRKGWRLALLLPVINQPLPDLLRRFVEVVTGETKGREYQKNDREEELSKTAMTTFRRTSVKRDPRSWRIRLRGGRRQQYAFSATRTIDLVTNPLCIRFQSLPTMRTLEFHIASFRTSDPRLVAVVGFVVSRNPNSGLVVRRRCSRVWRPMICVSWNAD
jgi:hypothetical protein